MPNPPGVDSPKEYFEIFNYSATSIDLQNWTIVDNNSADSLRFYNLDSTISALPANLQPGQYALVFEGDYDGSYYDMLPPDCLLLFVDSSTIGNNLGNSEDTLDLISPEGNTVSTASWESSVEGFSWERILPEAADIPQNWQLSSVENGSPGAQNSVAGQAVNLQLDSMQVRPEFPEKNQPFEVTVFFSNVGIAPNDAILELATFSANVSLDVGESDSLVFQMPAEDSGKHTFFAEIISEDDYDLTNNQLDISVFVQYEYLDVFINEIMYDPLSGESEWVELANASGLRVNLEGWYLADDEDLEHPLPEYIFEEFAVVTEDSNPAFCQFESLPNLNNDEDDIFLFDPSGVLIDHVHYRSEWGGGDGISLERLGMMLDSNDENNWAASADLSGSTPGASNSLWMEEESEAQILVNPQPFVKGQDELMTIQVVTPFIVSHLHLRIFDSRGRKQITLCHGQSVAASSVHYWDGRNENGDECRIGQYILLAEAENAQGNGYWEDVARVVILK